MGPQEGPQGRWVTGGREGGRLSRGSGDGKGSEPKLAVRQGLEALAETDPEHIKNLGKEQELVSCQDKWHKAHACFHSL